MFWGGYLFRLFSADISIATVREKEKFYLMWLAILFLPNKERKRSIEEANNRIFGARAVADKQYIPKMIVRTKKTGANLNIYWDLKINK